MCGNMWKCIKCGDESTDRPSVCNKCGLVQAGIGTREKYTILEEYCKPLSLIMRKNNLDHYFIDACAGSGKVQARTKDELIDGSPLIMVKTQERVEEIIRDKSKRKHAQSIFMEINPKTHALLVASLSGYSNYEVIQGDCNQLLPDVLNKIESKTWKPFCFIYIDPFGLGKPVIRMETLKGILQREYTELLLHLNMDAYIRSAGNLANLNSHNSRKKKLARSHYETLKLVLGSDQIQNFCNEWSTWPRGMKEKMCLQYYLLGLEGYYTHIQHIEIPAGSRRPVYYLVFATRNETGNDIMKGIMQKARRRGAVSLDKWFKEQTT